MAKQASEHVKAKVVVYNWTCPTCEAPQTVEGRCDVLTCNKCQCSQLAYTVALIDQAAEDALLAAMNTPEAKAAMDAAFHATPEELGAAAVEAASGQGFNVNDFDHLRGEATVTPEMVAEATEQLATGVAEISTAFEGLNVATAEAAAAMENFSAVAAEAGIEPEPEPEIAVEN